MSVPLRHADLEPRYSAFDAEERNEDPFALSACERIGGPVSESGFVSETSNALAWSVSVAIIVCAGWVLINRPANWPSQFSNMMGHALAALDQNANVPKPAPPPPPQQHPIETASTGVPYGPVQPPTPAPLPPVSSAPPAASSPPKPANATPVAASKPEAPAADKPAVTHEPVTATTDKDNTRDESDDEISDPPPRRKARRDAEASDLPSPLRLERPQPHDRIEARAESVGLHPGLSHAVLARFSSVDFRNARKAIDTAIARTPDNGVFIWPRQREPGRALFRVHFVPGAGPDCRRYVVTVTMNGWTTTALPMEKCGARRVTAQR